MCGQTNPDGGRVCGRETSGIGQRTLQIGSPSGGVNFFNAICRLLMYEGSFSTRFSDLLISTDSFVCAESVSAGVGLRSTFSVSIDPLQFIICNGFNYCNNFEFSSSWLYSERKMPWSRTHGWHKPRTRYASMLDSRTGPKIQRL